MIQSVPLNGISFKVLKKEKGCFWEFFKAYRHVKDAVMLLGRMVYFGILLQSVWLHKAHQKSM